MLDGAKLFSMKGVGASVLLAVLLSCSFAAIAFADERERQDDADCLEAALAEPLVVDSADSDAPGDALSVSPLDEGASVQEPPLSSRTVEDGVYIIETSVSEGQVLDIADGSLSDGANVQVYASNETGAQKFYFAGNGDGSYTIYNVASGKVLDVAGASPLSGANVCQYAPNGTDAQKWVPVYHGALDAYSLVSRVSGMFLDVEGGLAFDKANVQVYRGNGTAAQLFRLVRAEFLQSGIYAIESACRDGLAVDVAGAATDAGALMQLYWSNGSTAQRFEIARVGCNTYTLRSACSGLLVGVSDNHTVVLSADESRMSVRWRAFWNDGALMLVNMLDGRALSPAGEGIFSGAALSASFNVRAPEQRLLVRAAQLISNGHYSFISAVGGKALDVSGNDRRDYANVQVYDSYGGNAQKFYIELVEGPWYRFVSPMTLRVVDVDGGRSDPGANVQMYRYNGTDAQLWRVVIGRGGCFTLVNKGSGLVLDVEGAGNWNGANVQVYTANGTDAQRFRLVPTAYYPDSYVLLDVPVYNQYAAGLPTGCESCALTDALRYYGFGLGDAEIADGYMPWSSWDFVYAFWGNPHSASSNSTMAPCITNTANAYLAAHGSNLSASNVTGSDFYSLYSYIDRGCPVIIWSTIGMGGPGAVYGWQDGYAIHTGSHTIVLAGFNRANNTAYVSDSISGRFWCDAGRLSWLYDQMGRQAVVIA